MNAMPQILAQICSPIAQAQLVEWHWQTPLQADIRESSHMIEMSLPPLATEGLGSFPEIAPAQQYRIGRMFLRPAGVLLRARGPGGHIRVVRCAITPERFTALTGHETEWNEEELRTSLDLRSDAARLLMRRLYEELQIPGLASTALVEAYCIAIAIEVTRVLILGRSIDAPDGGRLAPWQYRRISERLATEGPAPSVSELAALCGLSPRHLLRLYRNFAGESVSTVIERAQAERARSLLAETSLPLKEIAARLGFSRPGSFSAAFARSSGVTPRQYRTYMARR